MSVVSVSSQVVYLLFHMIWLTNRISGGYRQGVWGRS